MGGLSYYNEEFTDITKDGKSAFRWVEQENTDEVYKNSSKILDINAKTGLYPLLVATSFFYK